MSAWRNFKDVVQSVARPASRSSRTCVQTVRHPSYAGLHCACMSRRCCRLTTCQVAVLPRRSLHLAPRITNRIANSPWRSCGSNSHKSFRVLQTLLCRTAPCGTSRRRRRLTILQAEASQRRSCWAMAAGQWSPRSSMALPLGTEMAPQQSQHSQLWCCSRSACGSRRQMVRSTRIVHRTTVMPFHMHSSFVSTPLASYLQKSHGQGYEPQGKSQRVTQFSHVHLPCRANRGGSWRV